jgi:hypothetical protein
MQALVLQPDIALTVVRGKAFQFGGGKALAGAESAEAPSRSTVRCAKSLAQITLAGERRAAPNKARKPCQRAGSSADS